MVDSIPEVAITRSIAIVFISLCIRWLLGCAKIVIVAFLFGAAFDYDAFLVAFTIPEMVTGLLVGVIAVTFIPIFTDYLVKEGEEQAWYFASNLINIFFIFGLLLSLLMIAITPLVIRLAAPGFDKDTFQLATRLTILITPLILIMALGELATRLLHTYKSFVIPSLALLLDVLVAIGCLAFLSRRYGIFSLAFGVLLGSLIRLLFQILFLWGKFKYFRLSLNLGHPGMRKISLIVAPMIFCMLFLRISIFIERILASGLKEGSISVLGYASKLTEVPAELFLGSLVIVLFPLISKYASESRLEDFKMILSKGIRIGNFIMVPIAVLFVSFRREIIWSLLERGQFLNSMTHDTSAALAIYALGLFAMAVYFFSTHACYALQEIKALIKITIFVTLLNIILKLSLINYLAFAGLALATSITLFLQSALIFDFVRRKIGVIDTKAIVISSLKVLVSSILMTGTCWLVLRFIPPSINRLLYLTTLLVTAIISYLVFAYLVGCQELTALRGLFKKVIFANI